MIDQRMVELRLSIPGQASPDKARAETVTRVWEECVGVWVCGCVGLWVCGCVGVWVCGCVGV